MYGYDLTLVFWLALIGLTFGIWKIIENIIWLFSHISITIH